LISNSYEYLYKSETTISSELFSQTSYDVFLSAYNSSDRVTNLFNAVHSKKKYWVVFPEYCYTPMDIQGLDNCYCCEKGRESDQIGDFLKSLNLNNSLRLCIDITGFIRPQLCFLIKYLHQIGIIAFDSIYTEPERYLDKEKQRFSHGHNIGVRPIEGYEGAHDPNISNDLLFIGAGYDQKMINLITTNKSKATRIDLIGFPSLRADMYQESLLQRYGTTYSSKAPDILMAPAYDPFVTASVLSNYYHNYKNSFGSPNLYLAPLSTKPQTLGFILFYLNELVNTSSTMIFPFSTGYEQETSEGIGRVWIYSVEFFNKACR